MKKVYVLFYKLNTIINNNSIEINHYRFFIYKKDLAIFLNQQPAEFTPLGIQKINVKNTIIVDKYFDKYKNFAKK